MNKKILSGLVLIFSLFLFSSFAMAADLYVDDDGKADGTSCNSLTNAYSTIGSAVSAAISNDIIHVCPGTYTEQVIINKALTLKGPNFGIDPNTGTRVSEATIKTDDLFDHQAVLIEASDVTVDGFTLYGPSGGPDPHPKDIGAIGLTSSGARTNVHIQYNSIFRTAGGTDWKCDGIRLDPPSNADASIYVEHNLINVGDTIQSAGNNDITLADIGYKNSPAGAAWIIGSPDRVVIKNNYLYGHSKMYIEGIGVLIDNNKFLGIWGPIEVRGSKDVVISNNEMMDQTDVAMYVWSPKTGNSGAGLCSDIIITDNFIEGMKLDPQVFTDEGTGIILGGVTNVLVTKNTIKNGAGSGVVIGGENYDHFDPNWGLAVGPYQPVNNVINYNNIFGNTLFGVRVDATVTSGTPIDAIKNWWGSDTGPGSVGPGSGDKVTKNVNFDPWLCMPYPPAIVSVNGKCPRQAIPSLSPIMMISLLLVLLFIGAKRIKV